jgi:hypothetical protein
MADSKEAEYFIRNPKAYKRLEAKDICDDGAVRLAETLLADLKEDMRTVAAKLKENPNSGECRASALSMLHLLQSDYVDALTMGHGQAVVDMYIGMCGGFIR